MHPARAPSPGESVVSGIGKMWGFRDLQELQSRDGKLFQREVARRLYGDLRRVVVDCLSSLRETTEGNPDAYREGLEHCRNWHPVVAREEMQNALRMFPDLQARIQAVAVLYAKTLYSEQCKLLGQPTDLQTMRMQRPNAENLLRGFFRRVCMSSWVKNGSFWDMDPIQQDFVLREAFRDALSQDCVKVTVTAIPAATFSSGSTVLPQQGTDDGLVTADDSISAVMARSPATPDRESEDDGEAQARPSESAQDASADAKADASKRLEKDRILPPELPLIVEWGPTASVPEVPLAPTNSASEALDALEPTKGAAPSVARSAAASVVHSVAQSVAHSVAQSAAPKKTGSVAPSIAPSIAPSVARGASASVAPSVVPSVAPSASPRVAPSAEPKLESGVPNVSETRDVTPRALSTAPSIHSIAKTRIVAPTPPAEDTRANADGRVDAADAAKAGAVAAANTDANDDAASVPATYVRDQILGPITVQLEEKSA